MYMSVCEWMKWWHRNTHSKHLRCVGVSVGVWTAAYYLGMYAMYV